MTNQLSKATLEALKVELAKFGLTVSVSRVRKGESEIDKRIAALRAMKFKTAATKGSLMATLATVKRFGFSNDRYAIDEKCYPPMGKRWDCINNAYGWRRPINQRLLTYNP